jgi:hypothetical protein
MVPTRYDYLSPTERVNDLRQIGTLFFRHNVWASKQAGLVQVG